MITAVAPLMHPGLQGVLVFPLDDNPKKDQPQQVLVVCAPNVQIPFHNHSQDASMFVVSGEARVRAKDAELDDQLVTIGDRVFFKKNQSHGFQVGAGGMSFLSTNGGIVDTDPINWNIQFV